jgi:hypothetical protein
MEKPLGWSTKIVQHPPKPRYIWLPKGVEPDWEKITAQLPLLVFMSYLADG